MCFQSWFTLETGSFSRRHVLPGTNCMLTARTQNPDFTSVTVERWKYKIWFEKLVMQMKNIFSDLNLCTLSGWKQIQKRFKRLQGGRWSWFLVKSAWEKLNGTFHTVKGILQAKEKPECAKIVTTWSRLHESVLKRWLIQELDQSELPDWKTWQKAADFQKHFTNWHLSSIDETDVECTPNREHKGETEWTAPVLKDWIHRL